jgi:hypothetical protein
MATTNHINPIKAEVDLTIARSGLMNPLMPYANNSAIAT